MYDKLQQRSKVIGRVTANEEAIKAMLAGRDGEGKQTICAES